jgi:hypothetical protein
MKYTAICVLLLSSSMAFGTKSVSGAAERTVNSFDRASKGLVIGTANRLRHAFQCTNQLSMHAADDLNATVKHHPIDVTAKEGRSNAEAPIYHTDNTGKNSACFIHKLA